MKGIDHRIFESVLLLHAAQKVHVETGASEKDAGALRSVNPS
jgi:hypothetical protein